MIDLLAPLSLIRDPARFGGVTAGDCLHGTPIIRDGRLVGLTSPTGGTPTMILPQLVEAHCHLDKCHSVHRLGPVGGTLSEAIVTQRADKANWTAQDLRTRTARGLTEAHAAGCRLIRSHVDWGDTADPPLAWSVLGELAQNSPGLQRSALLGIAQLADPDFARAIGPLLASDNATLGTFVLGQPEASAGLRAAFDIAMRHGLMLDFHVDEGLGDLNGLEQIADIAIKTGFEGPILCGHAVSLIDRDGDTLRRIIDKLLAARITVCALPTTNLYLQGRRDGTPDRRGLTRLRELHAAGVPISVASDNVADAFCPTGQHDPMAALSLAVLSAHLDPPLGQWLPAITTHAAAALGQDPVHIDGAQLDNLLICDVTHTADLVAGRAALTPARKRLT
ncbi:MAG: amidohydrolase family protein [Pseudomonadota bacterium]